MTGSSLVSALLFMHRVTQVFDWYSWNGCTCVLSLMLSFLALMPNGLCFHIPRGGWSSSLCSLPTNTSSLNVSYPSWMITLCQREKKKSTQHLACFVGLEKYRGYLKEIFICNLLAPLGGFVIWEDTPNMQRNLEKHLNSITCVCLTHYTTVHFITLIRTGCGPRSLLCLP